jgi:DNA mismatch repair protein MutS
MLVSKRTPLMEQYFDIRKDYQDALLFFQVGDFYELFFDDAKRVSSFLALTLTKRGKDNGEDIPLCGVPVSSLNHYVSKLVKGGFNVAICDQVSAAIPGQIVKRVVRHVLTPGTLIDASMLDEKRASYLLSFYPTLEGWGLVFSELLTAQLFATHFPSNSFNYLESELTRFFPDEVIIPSYQETSEFETFFKKKGYWVSKNDYAANPTSKAWVESQFSSLAINELSERPMLAGSMQQLHSYLSRTQSTALEQFKTINFYNSEQYLYLDAPTQKNLEIVKNNHDGSRKNTLLSVVDRAKTSMGSRTLHKWLTRPLLNKDAILERQKGVKGLLNSLSTMQQIEQLLGELSDIERIVGRIALHKASLQDYIALKNSLGLMPSIQKALENFASIDVMMTIKNKIAHFETIVTLLASSLEEELGATYLIKKGFDGELDRLRQLVENAQQEVLKLETREIEKTGIASLKIRYNSLSGYAIEITKTHLDKIPPHYIRQQTLTNRERYVIEELLALQEEIARAESSIGKVQDAVYERIKATVHERLHDLRATAHAIAYLDALFSFAQLAYDNDYVAPTFHDGRDIIIHKGRHPLVEQTIGAHYIANDTNLTNESSLWVITGPNMGGKSTYLRQVALISLLAQCGSFVPAAHAQLPILDRIFTRIGSGDNLAEGKSTFLVEMEETAAICRQATNKSLVILDEVGRGTSTYDGLAIAQAVIEYIATHVQARCLFATHYHELTELEKTFSGIKNYHMVCSRTPQGIIFQHTIAPGVAERSFGIEVARLAQLPEPILSRSYKILEDLSSRPQGMPSTQNESAVLHKKINELEKALAREQGLCTILEEINVDELTPRAAFDLLWKLKTR